MEEAIRTDRLTKRYGKARGIEDLSLSVSLGTTYGFLGPNGAGKTTLIRCLLDLLKPTSGQAFLFGTEVDSSAQGVALRNNVGYVAGEVRLFSKQTCQWHIDFISSLHGGSSSQQAEDLVKRLALDTSRKVRELSKGNKQKLALVLALMHDPKLLILDEPTSGLDPLNQEIVFDIIDERVTNEGVTLFLSSHILSEVQRVCTRVGIIRQGRLAAEEDVSQLLSKQLRHVRVSFAEDITADFFSGVPGIRQLAPVGENVFEASVVGTSLDALVKRLSERPLSDLSINQASLDEVFLEFYREDQEVLDHETR